MIIQVQENIQAGALDKLTEEVSAIGLSPSLVKTQYQQYLICTGKADVDIRQVGQLEGVRDIHAVSDQYKLVSSKWKVGYSTVDLGDGVVIGDGSCSIMAGPCSIESEEQIEETVKALVKNGIRIMRGGVFKPRSSPYSFRGMGIEGLKLFYQHCSKFGIKVITEVMSEEQIDGMHDYVDIFQVGARNSQNFTLLDALGRIDKAVLIKRGISGTIDELLYSAEYVFSGGNEKLMLCERGIRTHEKAYRNTFDINAIPILKAKTHLPVIADPSHGIGIREHVEPIALAAAVAGADGIIVEAHAQPNKAFSDAQQTISHEQLSRLVRKVGGLR